MIPEMTNPLGEYWEQPSARNMKFYSHEVAVDLRDFEQLAEYSATVPTGVYAGKMWKRRTSANQWFLCWYDYSSKPGQLIKRELPLRLM